jgi:hypothetical protein
MTNNKKVFKTFNTITNKESEANFFNGYQLKLKEMDQNYFFLNSLLRYIKF